MRASSSVRQSERIDKSGLTLSRFEPSAGQIHCIRRVPKIQVTSADYMVSIDVTEASNKNTPASVRSVMECVQWNIVNKLSPH